MKSSPAGLLASKLDTRASRWRAWRARFLLLVILVVLAGLVVALTARGIRLAARQYEDFHAVHARAAQAAAATRPMAISEPCVVLDAARAGKIRTQQAAAMIPLVPDLVLDDIWTAQGRDLEALVSIRAVDDASVSSAYSGTPVTVVRGKMVVGPNQRFPERRECQGDLLGAHVLVTAVNSDDLAVFNGTTHLSISREVYEQLKANQNTDFEYRQDFYRVADGYSWARDYKGTMQRDVLAPYTFHTLINGRATDLPALHATGVLGGNPATLTVLDDPANPLLLNFQISTLRFTINIAKISYPIPRALEAQLRDERRADIYGIYFDFDSSGLRSESSPVLAEIADALQQHPDWRLRISGHTDNIGSASRNLELSMQRAQAVKQALEDLHSIQADRLSVDGFGDTRPKSTNATVEGRALNRRVELVRE